MAGARKSAKYLFVGNLFSKTISFVGAIFLARLLFPEDYGYLLMAMIIAGFGQMLGNMGFENFYLQEKITSPLHEKSILNITFKLRLLLNTILFLLQFFTSYYIADFFQKEMVGELLRVFAFGYIINAFVQVNLFILRKKINYRPEAISNVFRDITSTLTKIAFAMMGFGALSFAYGTLVGNLFRVAIILKYQYFSPDIRAWDFDIFKKVFYFGKHTLLASIGQYLSTYIDKILLPMHYTTDTIGHYQFSFSQSTLLHNMFLSPQNSLLTSFTAKHKQNRDELGFILEKIRFFIGLVMIPIYVALYTLSDIIFLILFGEKWDAAIPIFQLFLVLKLFNTLSIYSYGSVLMGLGYPQVLSKIAWFSLLLIGVSLYVTTQISSDIFVYASVFILASMLTSIVKLHLTFRYMKKSIYDLLSNTYAFTVIILIDFVILNLIKYNVDNLFLKLLTSSVTLLLLSGILYFLIYRVKTKEVLVLLFPNSRIINKIYQNREKY